MRASRSIFARARTRAAGSLARARAGALRPACLLALLLGGAAALPAPRGHAATPGVLDVKFSIHGPLGDRESAIAVWPEQPPQNERWPILIAFHGMAESKEGRDKGYRAWLDKYGLGPAFQALLGGNLRKDNFGGLVRDAQLEALNAELKAKAFRGLFVVGIYTPDLISQVAKPEKIDAYAAWVATRLVQKIRDRFPAASQEPREVGLDGVSLGGMVALEVGLRYPDVFGSVGSMQPAIRGREEQMADLAAKAMAQKPQALRLLSSDDDPLLPVTRKLSEELRKRHVAHTLVVTPGGHDYAFNRGPGSIEMLRFHDRALRENRPR